MTSPAPPPPPGDRRLAHLDGWRGLSIILVLIGHFTPADRAAHVGVELFFVLSGRLMARILIEERQPVATFVRRRVARVWPALWVYVALMTVGLSVSHALGDERHALIGALAAVTFTANYVAATVSMPYFDHGWSLAVEEHGYLLLAGIAAMASRRRDAAAGAALVLATLAMANGWWQALATDNPYYIYLRSDVRIASVLLPFALYLIAQMPQVRATLTRLPWLWLVGLIVGVWFGTRDPGPARFVIGSAGLALAGVTIDHAPRPVLRALEHRLLGWIAAMSFSLYLWQQPFMMLRRAGVWSPLCLALACLFGGWSYYRVERPTRVRLASMQPRPWRRYGGARPDAMGRSA